MDTPDITTTKRCTKCGETKPRDQFHKDKSRVDCLTPQCKSCIAKTTKAWREANKGPKAKMNRAWYEANRDRATEMGKAWRKANLDSSRATYHRRLARKHSLPDTFTAADWQRVFDHFGGCCAACGRQPGLWHTLAADHWVPLTSPDCPGTVAWNIVPLCHGNGGCNNTKNAKNPSEWVIERFGKRKGRAILKRIEAFLDSRRPDSEASA